MQKKAVLIFIHVFAWFTFLALPYMFKPSHRPERGNEIIHAMPPTPSPSNDMHIAPPDGRDGVINDILLPPRIANGIFFIVLFYTNYLFLIPYFHRSKRYWILALSIAGSFACFILINLLMRPASMRGTNEVFSMFGHPNNIFMYLIVLVFSFTISFYKYIRSIENEKHLAEVSFLKAQINPHFLFNTLNSIYSLSIKKSDDTPNAIVKLSSIMRYSITDAGNSYVPLAKEIEYISNYISLQRLRITDAVTLHVDISGSAEGKQIAPLLLISFIENAFKYGVNPEERSVINIHINTEGNDLILLVSNDKVYVQKDVNDTRAGLGINNTIHRLQLLYPNKHHLDIQDGDDRYIVSLKIQLA